MSDGNGTVCVRVCVCVCACACVCVYVYVYVYVYGTCTCTVRVRVRVHLPAMPGLLWCGRAVKQQWEGVCVCVCVCVCVYTCWLLCFSPLDVRSLVSPSCRAFFSKTYMTPSGLSSRFLPALSPFKLTDRKGRRVRWRSKAAASCSFERFFLFYLLYSFLFFLSLDVYNCSFFFLPYSNILIYRLYSYDQYFEIVFIKC